MRKLTSFTSISLDGYFADANGDMNWAHAGSDDPEVQEFTANNAKGGGELLFGRVTWQMMESFWPTPMANQQFPEVAEGMKRMVKHVASRTLSSVQWENAHLLKGDLIDEVRKLKAKDDPGIAILGSGSIVRQLAGADLIDEFQIVIVPVLLGGGKSLFSGVPVHTPLKLTENRAFRTGRVFLRYEPA